MKRLAILLFLFVLVYWCAPVSVSADPRMEINDNFCHFILDPLNTDNEVFESGCNATIVTLTGNMTRMVVGEQESNGNPRAQCSEYVASGYGTVTKQVPVSAVALPIGTVLKFSSDDSDTPCTMVESNGRQYISYNWESKIRVVQGNAIGMMKIIYQLTCKDGKQ
jgi:hypothetical protein